MASETDSIMATHGSDSPVEDNVHMEEDLTASSTESENDKDNNDIGYHAYHLDKSKDVEVLIDGFEESWVWVQGGRIALWTDEHGARPKPKQMLENKNETRQDSTSGLQVQIDDQWHPAIYHHDYVKTFPEAVLNPSKKQNYVYERATGRHGKYDFTAFHKGQSAWGEVRDSRPAVLFDLKMPAGDCVIPPDLVHVELTGHARIVIDSYFNAPLKAYPNLPVTISTAVEGYLMEAWIRQNYTINVDDFFQRMPPGFRTGLKSQRNMLSARSRRFRQEGRLLSWAYNVHDSAWDKKILEEVGRRPDWVRMNTTLFLKDLEREEMEDIEKAIHVTGKYAARSRNPAVE